MQKNSTTEAVNYLSRITSYPIPNRTKYMEKIFQEIDKNPSHFLEEIRGACKDFLKDFPPPERFYLDGRILRDKEEVFDEVDIGNIILGA